MLGDVPTQSTVIAERFFDEGGGMQLIIHAPFGARINKAWGLALRKRFCRSFNFELQAAATDNGLNIALAEQHSFPLGDVFHFLNAETVQPILEQAALASPIFGTRWRWDANRSLALLRFQGGKKVPPQIQRMRSDDLLASVFPDVAACQENIVGDIQIPDHPLVKEVMKDVLTEAMDIDGLKELLRAHGRRPHSLHCCRYAGAVAVLARDTECESVCVSRRCAARRTPRARSRNAADSAGVGAGGSWASSIPRRSSRYEKRPGPMSAMRMSCTMCCTRLIAFPVTGPHSELVGTGVLARPVEQSSTSWQPFFAQLFSQGRAVAATVEGRSLLGRGRTRKSFCQAVSRGSVCRAGT